MYRAPFNNPNRFYQQPVVRQKQRKKKPKFRKTWLLVPIATALSLFVLTNIDAAYSWSDILEWANVREEEKFTKLCVLGLIIVGVVAVRKILKDPQNK
ncbi:hypothetical protein ACFL3Q_08310 [Planctomycetota bacterium]